MPQGRCEEQLDEGSLRGNVAFSILPGSHKPGSGEGRGGRHCCTLFVPQLEFFPFILPSLPPSLAAYTWQLSLRDDDRLQYCGLGLQV